MRHDDQDNSPNPAFQRPHPKEHPAVEKARLLRWHKRNQSMELWYELYPEERPVRPERQAEDRGGR